VHRSEGFVHIRILVVDDEQDNCDYLKLVLSKESYDVTTLTDPTKVPELLRQSDFHLVLLDMMMPQMSGTEVLEQIRKMDTDIAVVVATAYPTVDTAVASLKAQASDYVKKPLEPEEILAVVRRALAKKGLSKDPEADLHRAIGRTIRDARKTQDLTLKQLARRTGLSVSLLSQIERAESSASISSLYKIASALQLRMSDLFGEA
jgi:DNA-binding NtrC family response regulator